MKLKNCIRFFVMLAFVATTMPTLAHAGMHEETAVKSTKIEHDQQFESDHDCCPPSKKDCPEKMASSDGKTQPDKKGCCDKSGKCMSNSCNSAAKVLGLNGFNEFSQTATKSQFSLSQENSVSNLTDRIKRPPRA